MKKINLYVDMDGTVAKFYHDKKCLEKMFEPNYFRTLPPYAIAKEIDCLAKISACIEVFILSACVDSPYCKSEKLYWLAEHMPNIKPENIILIDVNQSKIDCIKDRFDGNAYNILLDDYTKNLQEWLLYGDDTCGAIKFINGINDKSKKWNGKRVRTFKQLQKILINQLTNYIKSDIM